MTKQIKHSLITANIASFAQIVSKLDKTHFENSSERKLQTSIARTSIVGHIWYRCFFANWQMPCKSRIVSQAEFVCQNKPAILARHNIYRTSRTCSEICAGRSSAKILLIEHENRINPILFRQEKIYFGQYWYLS